MSTPRRGLALAALGMTLLTGCAVGPDYKRPDIALPSSYPQSDQAQAGQGTVSAAWWKLYNDATLDDLVDATLKNNADMHNAVAQIDEAQAVFTQASSSLFPEFDLNAASTKARSSTLNAQPLPPGTPTVTKSTRLTLSTSFELDLWGHLRRISESAKAQLLASRYARDVLALTLAGTTTQAYLTLRSLDSQIAVTTVTLASRDDALAVVINRAKAGIASDLDVSQADGARADVAVQLRELQRQRALIEHQLGNLTGKLDLKIPAGDLLLLPTPAIPPAGLPSTLLQRRPDVQQAEQNLIAANALIGASKAAQFPTFTLTGNYGGQSEALADITKDAARVWSFAPAMTLPIFDAGRLAARTRQAEARQRQALASYQKTVENAFSEVADALTNVQHSSVIVADIQRKADAAHLALRLSRLRYEAGYSAYIEVLDAQRDANIAEQALLLNRRAQLSYNVDLMKALGGGWSPTGKTAN
jgi:outer membrane protein, multidrug efflux system